MDDFNGFPKIARLSREMIITEKIDGTNGQIFIKELDGFIPENCLFSKDGLAMWVGSRSRWITPLQDNHGFASWAYDHKDELLTLGIGRHFGEWWGNGIQRGYGLPKGEKRFSLFNVKRWGDDYIRPKCCHVVPVLYTGVFNTEMVLETMNYLWLNGSSAAPGFMNPEGVVVYHTAGNVMFKKTFEKDDCGKDNG